MMEFVLCMLVLAAWLSGFMAGVMFWFGRERQMDRANKERGKQP